MFLDSLRILFPNELELFFLSIKIHLFEKEHYLITNEYWVSFAFKMGANRVFLLQSFLNWNDLNLAYDCNVCY